MIPKIIYKTGRWKEYKLPEEIVHIFDKIKKDNPGITLSYFDDSMCRSFILKNFKKEVVFAYDKLIPTAYKADLFRYCLMYQNGGIYADLLHRYSKPFDNIIDFQKDELCLTRDKINIECGETEGIQISFMAAAPKNVLFLMVINQVVKNVRNNYYGKCPLAPTGPILFKEVLEKANKSLAIDLKHRYILQQRGNKYLVDNLNRTRFCTTKTEDLKKKLYPDLSKHYQELWVNKKIYK